MHSIHLAPDLTLSYKISIDTRDSISYITFNGVIRLKELVDSFSELVRHPDFTKNMACCYDCRNGLVEVNLNETEIFYHFAAGMREKRGNRYSLAFIYGDEMTKMLVQFYRLFLARTEIDVEIFPNVKAAIGWIKDNHH